MGSATRGRVPGWGCALAYTTLTRDWNFNPVNRPPLLRVDPGMDYRIVNPYQIGPIFGGKAYQTVNRPLNGLYTVLNH